MLTNFRKTGFKKPRGPGPRLMHPKKKTKKDFFLNWIFVVFPRFFNVFYGFPTIFFNFHQFPPIFINFQQFSTISIKFCHQKPPFGWGNARHPLVGAAQAPFGWGRASDPSALEKVHRKFSIRKQFNNNCRKRRTTLKRNILEKNTVSFLYVNTS